MNGSGGLPTEYSFGVCRDPAGLLTEYSFGVRRGQADYQLNIHCVYEWIRRIADQIFIWCMQGSGGITERIFILYTQGSGGLPTDYRPNIK
jgi:hypothetical protein